MTLGENILRLRKLKGLSQEELADKLNVSRQSVSLWETNQTVPQIDYLIELSRIFNVTLDELCVNDVKQENNEIVDQKEIEEIDVPLATTHFEYDEDKIKKLIKILDKKRHTRFAIWLNCIIIGLLALFVDDFETVIGAFLAINILLFIYFKILNKKSLNILINEKRVIDIKFYKDYFVSKLKTRSLDIETKLKYIDIDKLHIDDELVVIVYSNNSKYVVFEQKELIENKELILLQLKEQSKSCNQKNYQANNNTKLKVFSIILFIASFAAIILALMGTALVSGLSKYSFANNRTFVLNTWVFFVVAIIPASSLVFGIIFNNRFKCKKNIISGIIMTAILVLYGSFCIIFRPFFSFDENYLNDVAVETNINFPSEFLLVTESLTGSKETYVKFENENEVVEFENKLTNSNIWSDISNLPSNLDLTILFTIQSYDYYYIHTIDSQEANSFNERNIKQIILAYDIETDILIIYEIKATNEN